MSKVTHARLLRGSGVLLILLGLVHLVATRHISALIRHLTSSRAADQLIPPMLLNHIIAGLLLLPLGYLVYYAAPYSAAGESWAQMIARVVAVTVMSLPIAVLLLMGRRYFDAPLFVIGTGLVTAAAFTLLVTAFSAPRDSSKRMPLQGET